MKLALPVVTAVVAVGLLFGALWAEDAAPPGDGTAAAEFTMKPKALGSGMPDISDVCHISLAGLLSGEARRVGLKVPPAKANANTHYYAHRVGETDLLMAVEYGRGGSKITIDTNGDGNLSNDPTIVARLARSGRHVSQPIPIKGPEGKRVIIQLEVRSEWSMWICPGAAMAGSVNVGGKSMMVYAIDGNFDGDYDDAYSDKGGISGACDFLAVDLNGNRRLDTQVAGPCEVMPLPKRVVTSAGVFEVNVNGDGEGGTLRPATVATGKVDVGCNVADMLFVSENGAFRVCEGTSAIELPAGHYRPLSVGLKKTVGNAVYTLEGNVGGRLGPFDVFDGQATALSMGTPLVVKVQMSRVSSDEVMLYFNVRGSADEPYAPVAQRNGRDLPLPRFTIVDESGKKVGSGSWSYG